MSVQEAIEKIRYRIHTATEIVGKDMDDKAFEDLNCAIDALEKLVPMSIDIVSRRYYKCPKCDKRYELYCDIYNYCPNCGQALSYKQNKKG